MGGVCSGVSLTPTSGPVGTSISLALNDINEKMLGNYEIQWSTSPAFIQGNTTILAKGKIPPQNTSFNTQVKIPESTYGTHYLKFLSIDNDTFVNFQIGVTPSIKLSKLSVKYGEIIRLDGAGFPATDIIYIKLDYNIIDTNITTNAEGSFSHNLHVPLLNPGEYKLVASSATLGIYESAVLKILPSADETTTENGNSSSETQYITQGNTQPPQMVKPSIDIYPPAMPVPRSPTGGTIGSTGPQLIKFSWSEVSDESGVKYTLEISDELHPAGFKPIMTFKGLPTNSHEAWLDPGTYYWRVKAVDNAGNESNWYFASHPFKVSEISVFVDESLDAMQKLNLWPILTAIVCIGILWYVITVIQRSIKQAKDKDKGND